MKIKYHLYLLDLNQNSIKINAKQFNFKAQIQAKQGINKLAKHSTPTHASRQA